MLDGSFVFSEKVLDGIEGGLAQLLKDAKAEGLRAGGIDSIEDGDCAAAFDPGGAALGELEDAGLGVLGAGKAFRAFEAS